MDLNKVMLLGNVGKDPEYHHMKVGDNEMCKFSVATTRRWKDKNTGETKEDTSWHNIVVFNPYLVANVCRPMIQKGTRVYVEGEIKTRSYEKDGERKWITEIIIAQVKGEIMVEAKGKGWDVNETPGSERRGSSGQQSAAELAQRALDNEFDDDIPF